jgi:hypothetical protein
MHLIQKHISAVQVASKSLMEAITEVYEPQWSGSEALYAQASSIEVLWQDFSHKLGDQVLIPLNTYTAQFPEMRVCPTFIIFKCKSHNFIYAFSEKNRQAWPQIS